MKRKLHIHIVPRNKFPAKASGIKNLHGYQDKDHVYILKGDRDAEATKHHEIYHFKKNHPEKPRKPSHYIRQEIEANAYAMKKTGMKKHIKPELIAVANDVHHDYKMPVSRVLRTMSSEIRKKNVPKSYKQDFNAVASKTYKGRRLPKGLKVKE